MTTVICLDDYHALDRTGRKVKNVTALDPLAQNFDLMASQVCVCVGGGGSCWYFFCGMSAVHGGLYAACMCGVCACLPGAC